MAVKRITIRISGSTSTPNLSSYAEKLYANWMYEQGFSPYEQTVFYKYLGIDIKKNEIIHKVQNKKEKEKKKLFLEKEFVVELGGPFEQIGEQQDDIGGGKQKVGSGN